MPAPADRRDPIKRSERPTPHVHPALQAIATIPEFTWELSFDIYLIDKGFKPLPDPDSSRSRTRRTERKSIVDRNNGDAAGQARPRHRVDPCRLLPSARGGSGVSVNRRDQ